MKMPEKQFHKSKKKTRKKNRKLPSLNSSPESILDLLDLLNVNEVVHPQTIISKIVHFLFLEENCFLLYKM